MQCDGKKESGGSLPLFSLPFAKFTNLQQFQFCTISRIPDRETKKTRIQCPNFVESRFSGNSRILFPVKIFYVFQNPALYLGQIPDPENTLSHPVLWPSENYKIYKLNDLSLETFYEFCKVRNCHAFSKRRCWSLRPPASFLWKPAFGNFF